MITGWRKLLRHWHPEGIPWPASILYNAVSRSRIFTQHYQLVAILVVASFSGNAVVINNLSDASRWILIWLAMLALWVVCCIWVARKRSQIYLEQGMFSTDDETTADERRMRWGLAARAYGGLAALIFGLGGLLIMLVYHQSNRFVSGALLIMAIAAWLSGARIIMQHPEWIYRVFSTVRCGLALVTLITLNLLWNSWISHPAGQHPDYLGGFHLAPLFLNFLIVVFFGSLELASWLVWRFTMTTERRG